MAAYPKLNKTLHPDLLQWVSPGETNSSATVNTVLRKEK